MLAADERRWLAPVCLEHRRFFDHRVRHDQRAGPKEIQKLSLQGEGSTFQLEFDPRGDYLYVVSQRASATTPIGQGNTLHTLRVNANGLLSEPDAPTVLNLPLGTRPQGLATL